MRIPSPPPHRRLERISPSLFEAALSCKARASWMATSEQNRLPQHPAALLGRCFHAVMAAASQGRLAPGDDLGRTTARELFDRLAQLQYDEAHPLLRLKFPSVERLPFFNLVRERAALHATRLIEPSASRDPTLQVFPANRPPTQTETTLSSSDGLVVGRPDHINLSDSVVLDYKTGVGPEQQEGGISDSEKRQLLLYAYLALENGVQLSKAVIVRGDGRQAVIDVSAAEAIQAGQSAKDALKDFNAAVDASRSFEDIATPSPSACRNCPCIPFCGSFWEAAQPTWPEDFGACLEGTITAISRSTSQGIALVSVSVDANRGTVKPGRAILEQIPEQWIVVDGSAMPAVGSVVRLVNGRLVPSDEVPIVRIDKTTTALWSA